MALEIGKQLGPYKILGSAGAGGMGEVYKATDTRLDREVAIKVLHTKVANSADIKERFEREAKVIAGLNHPNICTLFDIGYEDGIDYLVMEYIEGETLSDRLANGPLPNEELLTVAIQIADALDKAHKQGLVHRDLKPGNVMLTKEGAKLLDFGLAKFTPQVGFLDALSSAETRTTPLTTQGAIIGTLQYMAPEQLEGEEADARSDIFAFGATLYQMATGENAFEGKSRASLIASVLKEQPRDISEISSKTPLALEKVIKQCLSKDPEQRWQSAGDLKRSLTLIAEGGSISAESRAVKSANASKLPWVLVATLAVATVVFATLWNSKSGEPPGEIRSRFLEPVETEFVNWAGGDAVLSPNGLSLAFLASATAAGEDQGMIWVRALNSLEAQPLRGTEGATFPFWSPDSKSIGFFSGGKLRKILATGGPALTLCDAPQSRGGSWNGDDVILFTPRSSGPIYRIGAGGGEPQVALSLDTAFKDYTHRWVRFLPDGNHFLYFARTGGEAGSEQDAICVASLSGGERKRLINARSNAEFCDENILFVRDDVLMAQPFDATTIENSGDVFPVAENVTYVADWSRGVFSAIEGGKILYRSGLLTSTAQLRILDESGKTLDTIGKAGQSQYPRISPDGRKVVFSLTEAGAPNADIWMQHLEQGTRTRLTFEETSDYSPVWSPTGDRIAYISVKGVFRIFVRDIGGSGEATLLLSDSASITPSDWSEDGKYLIYDRLSPITGSDVYAKSIDDDSEPVALINSEDWESEPAVSPDGRWLAYTGNSNSPEIYVTNFPSPDGKWQISLNGGGKPRWSVAGDKLFYVDSRDNVVSVDVDGSGMAFRVGKATQLFRLRAARIGSSYDVFKDGKRFLVNARLDDNYVPSMVLIQNWKASNSAR